MAVIRVNKTKDYTVMSNIHFKDKRLSLKAKGLLSQMLSLPEDWDYSITGLGAINKENETAIASALKELQKAGYLQITKLMPDRTESGRIEYIYDIFEQPVEKQGLEKQDPEFLGLEFLGLENQGQLNTNKSNTKRSNTKDLITNYTNDPELADALKDFGEMRRKIRKPMTERAWTLIFNKLDKCGATTEAKIACLEQSIEHCWQSVYPLKETGLNRQKTAEERIGWIDDIR